MAIRDIGFGKKAFERLDFGKTVFAQLVFGKMAIERGREEGEFWKMDFGRFDSGF